MERELVITQKIKLHASPFDGVKLSKRLRRYAWSVYGAEVIDVSITETTKPDTIASAVGDEVAGIKGQAGFVNPVGDNGEDDRGYEVVSGNGKRCVIDIGVVRCMDGIWYVVAERGHVDYPIDSADDLRELLA